MRLRDLSVDGFRNLNGATLRFDATVSLFHGDNAQGKTNLLEAIYILGTTRSFRENRHDYLIGEGREAARLEGRVEYPGVNHELSVVIGRDGKQYLKDNAQVPLPAYLETMPVVILSVEDRSLVGGAPKFRRDFLDASAVRRRSAYLDTLLAFGRCLRQRNQLLKADPVPSRELDAWTRTYTGLSDEIRRERRDVSGRINVLLDKLGGELDNRERVRIVYNPSGGKDLAGSLARLRSEEARVGTTLAGPHRDKVEVLLNGKPMGAYGSAGQVRTAVWMLKLTSVLMVVEKGGDAPLFLLDDVEAELDSSRVGKMMRLMQDRAQLIMTATRPLSDEWVHPHQFRVEDGRIIDEG